MRYSGPSINTYTKADGTSSDTAPEKPTGSDKLYYDIGTASDVTADGTNCSYTLRTTGWTECYPLPKVPAVKGYTFTTNEVGFPIVEIEIPDDDSNISWYNISFSIDGKKWESVPMQRNNTRRWAVPFQQLEPGAYKYMTIESVPKDSTAYSRGLLKAECDVVITEGDALAAPKVGFPEDGRYRIKSGLDAGSLFRIDFKKDMKTIVRIGSGLINNDGMSNGDAPKKPTDDSKLYYLMKQ